MCKIIFIGGVSGVGKTTLAYKLAIKYKIDKVISMDVLKSIIKEYEKKGDKYLYTTTHEAYKLDNLSVIEGFIKHSIIMDKYCKILIDTFLNEKIIIVEGATITQRTISLFKNCEACYINLYIDEKEKLIKRYHSKLKIRKGKWIENIDNILLINDYLKKQADININANNIKKNMNKLEEIINESLFL